MSNPRLSVQRVLDALPQTQCTRCGFPDCASYAQAIASDQAAINRCPPGGAEGVHRLAIATGLAPMPLDPAFGIEEPRKMAVIDETWCIGCTLCVIACPVDAIIGANKLMHTVLEAHCTGCELCVPACPVDCIRLENASGAQTGWGAWSDAQADEARRRHARHLQRMQPAGTAAACASSPKAPEHAAQHDPSQQKRSMAQAALAKARARKPA